MQHERLEGAMRKSLCLLVGLVSGCGAAIESEEALLASLPSRQAMEVSVPTGPAALRAGSAALVGETAGLYVVTRQTTTRMNGLVGGVLDQLGSIARTRPTAVEADTAAWGPLTDVLSPVVWRLVVRRLGPGEHAFLLEVRPKAGADGDFRPFLQGASARPGPAGPAQGSFAVNLGLAHALDPVMNPAVGQLAAAWNMQVDRREVHLQLAGVSQPSEPPATGDFGAVLLPDGSGALVFDANANLLGSADALEVGRVSSRWNAAGAGRADAELHQGDAGAGTQVTECWDASFGRVYFHGQTGAGADASEGDAAACVFADPLR
jgi:hypothetical protein